MNKAIAFCADFNYADKVLTTIKSICANNVRGGLTFYILNVDFPQEWFIHIRRKLAVVGARIEDVKIFREWVVEPALGSGHSHVNYAASLIFFVPSQVPADKVLYLDGDVIVTEDLSPLFELDMGDYPIAAVNDLDIQTDMQNLGIYDTFNSGVVLFNNRFLRQQNQSSILLDTAKEHYEEIWMGDQSVLNIAFKDNWLHLDRTYNHLLTADSIWDFGDRRGHNIGKLKEVPAILHYCSNFKPWKIDCWLQLKELWWYYYGLEWSEIALGSSYQLQDKTRPQLLIVTESGFIHGLEALAQALPAMDIHVCAYTNFRSEIIRLITHENIKLHSHVLHITLDDLLEECDAYLDIHEGREVYDAIQKMQAKGKPVFGFVETSHDNSGTSHLYSLNQVNHMANDIREILG